MKLTGTHTISAPPERAFELLIDPEVLTRCMPGCEKLEHTGDGVYDIAISAGVGPIRGKYTGSVTLSDLQPPEQYTMLVDIKGTTGFVKGEGIIELAPDGDNTQITFNGEVQIGGPLAAVGQRMHNSAARLMTRQLFGAIDAEAQAPPGDKVKHSIVRDILRTMKK